MAEIGQQALRERTLRLRWKQVSTRKEAALGLYRGSVTLVGSKVHCASDQKLWVLSSKGWKWKRLKKVTLEIGGEHAAQLAHDKIYFFGGRHSPVVVEYDILLQKSRRINVFTGGPKGILRMSAVFAPWRNEVITFGGNYYGNNSYVFSNQTHAINVETNCWRNLRVRGKVPQGRNGHYAAIHGTKMYIFGGYGASSQPMWDLWIAELHTASIPFWTKLEVNGFDLNPRGIAALTNLDEFLVFFGGDPMVGSHRRRNLTVYSPKTAAWKDQSRSEVVVSGTAPADIRLTRAVTTFNGILYFTNDGIYLLSEE